MNISILIIFYVRYLSNITPDDAVSFSTLDCLVYQFLFIRVWSRRRYVKLEMFKIINKLQLFQHLFN